MAITALPTPPSRSDPANFSANGDAFLGALPQMVTELNTTSASMDASVISASQSATLASESADAALANSNAIKWISGTTYAIGDVRWSPITFLSYRRKTAGAGTTDPSADTTNWADIVIRKNFTRSARTSNVILGVTDANVFVDITAGTFTQTFAAAATLTSGWSCYIRNSGSGVITLDPNSAETIDGLATLVMYSGETRLIQCDGSVLRSLVITPFRLVSDTSGSFVWPPGYASFTAILSGAGGGGAGGGGGACGTTNSASGRSGGGGSGGAGGSSGQIITKKISAGLVTPGVSASYAIGAGGGGGAGGSGRPGVTNSLGVAGSVGGIGSAGGASTLGGATDLFYLVAPGGGGSPSGGLGGTLASGAAGVSNNNALLTSDIDGLGAILFTNTNGGTSSAGGAGQSSGPAGAAGSAGGVSSTNYWLATGVNAGVSGAGSSTLGVAGSPGSTPAKAPVGCGGGGGGGGGGSSGAVASGTSGNGGNGGNGGIGGDGRLELIGGC